MSGTEVRVCFHVYSYVFTYHVRVHMYAFKYTCTLEQVFNTMRLYIFVCVLCVCAYVHVHMYDMISIYRRGPAARVLLPTAGPSLGRYPSITLRCWWSVPTPSQWHAEKKVELACAVSMGQDAEGQVGGKRQQHGCCKIRGHCIIRGTGAVHKDGR